MDELFQCAVTFPAQETITRVMGCTVTETKYIFLREIRSYLMKNGGRLPPGCLSNNFCITIADRL